jgi:hypothetical protein
MTWTTPTCRSNALPRWPRRHSTTNPAMDLHWRRRCAPRLPPLDAVVISITLGALFWLKIASSGRGTLAGTRSAHLNCNDKKTEGSIRVEGL